MTAKENKYNIGDAVRHPYDRKKKFIIVYISDKEAYIAHSSANSFYNGIHKYSLEDLKPWSNKLRCPFCGEEIVIERRSYDRREAGSYYVENTDHDDKCPMVSELKCFNTKQEALDAYSMRSRYE